MNQQSLSHRADREPQDTPTPEELDAHLSSDPESAVPEPETQGWFGKFTFAFCIFVALSHIYFNTLGNMSELWLSAMHFGMFGFLCALLYRTGKDKTGVTKTFHWGINILLGGLSLVVVAYLMLGESALYARGVTFISTDWLAAIVAVILVVEFARRTSGWVIPVMILIALSYVAWWGKYLTGVFHFPGLTAETLLFRSYFSNEGMFGSIARISSTYVYMFILFGAFLVRSGAGEFIIELARCVAGRMIGGPGLVAVVGSSLMGSISGSAVANTVSTGVITIPMMKRAGFRPVYAGGIEAAASTGGQLMPPVMGAGAFIMASYTQVPYLEIITLAFLPAMIYFLSVAFFVRIEAKRLNIQVVEEETPRAIDILKRGWHSLVPIVVLVVLLIYGFTPTYAAGFSILSVVIASWLSPNPMGLRDIAGSMVQGTYNMIPTAVLLIAVGLVINVVTTTGVGNTFSLMISQWSGGSLLISLVLVALASLIVGMGLPVTASYIVLGTLSAPALYSLMNESHLIDYLMSGQVEGMASAMITLSLPSLAEALPQGLTLAQAQQVIATLPSDSLDMVIEQGLSAETLTISLISAHMIIFWLSQDSNVTPPVCLAAFAAAAVARANPMRTGFMAWRFAKALYVVPLLFVYTPLIGGTLAEVLQIFIFACLGMYALAGFFENHLEGPLQLWQRILLVPAAGLMLWPDLGLVAQLAGFAILLVLFVLSRRAEPVNPHRVVSAEAA
ncbi:TRAP transporter permease [Oceanospirillum linum]|uniref:TRAP transporter permease n=1 Tax=Oceanospirillum linum TaxID=966 RepID=UPI00089F4AA4|nr:TRAP transporter permease [Oceanospirillum linum]SEG25798.1 TRAP transporter, 4TM/12TM fusion protein [Oleiphilus messinensis]SMP27908.1 TRAP transporter, 4TM/12TM fusion protein [Oceanospirillum linum]